MTTIAGLAPSLATQVDTRLETVADALFAALGDLATAGTAATAAAGRNQPLTSAEQAALMIAMQNTQLAMGAYQTLTTLDRADTEPTAVPPLALVVDNYGGRTEQVTYDDLILGDRIAWDAWGTVDGLAGRAGRIQVGFCPDGDGVSVERWVDADATVWRLTEGRCVFTATDEDTGGTYHQAHYPPHGVCQIQDGTHSLGASLLGGA